MFEPPVLSITNYTNRGIWIVAKKTKGKHLPEGCLLRCDVPVLVVEFWVRALALLELARSLHEDHHGHPVWGVAVWAGAAVGAVPVWFAGAAAGTGVAPKKRLLRLVERAAGTVAAAKR